MNSLLSKSILEMDQFIVERVNINQSNVPSRRVWLFTLSPDKQNLLLFSNQPIQLKTRSACVLVAGTQRNFFTSLVKAAYSSLLVFHQPRGSLSLSTEGSFVNLPDKNETMKSIFFYKLF